MPERPTIGVVGATGAVGTVTLELLEREGYENVRVFASARSAGTAARPLHGRGSDARSALARRRRPLPLLRRHERVARARAARRRRRRRRDRQVVGVPARPALPARRARGERRPRDRRDHREPELLHDPADLRAEAAARRGRPDARSARDVPVGLRRGRRNRWSACATSRRPSTTCRWTGSSTARSSTRSRSSAPRRRRSWSCPTCRSRRRASGCRCWSATPRPCGSRPRTS